ncbi:MAG: hypothetical protein A3F11_01450 [Gammaproteobacteria bacterium RIFCSPHIGHO2_12_FULL_37_14]|nr:MAG: hypothetical protein A3F11_01450 [Gammaproteobacteria bacterium RIFCSPHIGHO2_12_FULL_37_14]
MSPNLPKFYMNEKYCTELSTWLKSLPLDAIIVLLKSTHLITKKPFYPYSFTLAVITAFCRDGYNGTPPNDMFFGYTATGLKNNHEQHGIKWNLITKKIGIWFVEVLALILNKSPQDPKGRRVKKLTAMHPNHEPFKHKFHYSKTDVAELKKESVVAPISQISRNGGIPKYTVDVAACDNLITSLCALNHRAPYPEIMTWMNIEPTYFHQSVQDSNPSKKNYGMTFIELKKWKHVNIEFNAALNRQEPSSWIKPWMNIEPGRFHPPTQDSNQSKRSSITFIDANSTTPKKQKHANHDYITIESDDDAMNDIDVVDAVDARVIKHENSSTETTITPISPLNQPSVLSLFNSNSFFNNNINNNNHCNETHSPHMLPQVRMDSSTEEQLKEEIIRLQRVTALQQETIDKQQREIQMMKDINYALNTQCLESQLNLNELQEQLKNHEPVRSTRRQ